MSTERYIVDVAIDEQFDRHAAAVRRLGELREVERMAQAGAKRFGGHVFVNGHGLDWWPYYINWTVVVGDFREAAAMIEFVEDWAPLKLACSGSSDSPEILRERAYKFSPLFTLSCHLRDDSDTCKAVIKGYKREPIYEFECAEAVT